jgi:AraC-like DNA-binding protein
MAARTPDKTAQQNGPLDGSVRVEALRCYSEVVEALGGQPRKLLARARVPYHALVKADAFISYRAMINLLELSAQELSCDDFGLKLASHQGSTAVLGPLDLAMRNSSTVGEAFRYCAGHLQVYSPVVKIAIEALEAAGQHLMRFEILLRRLSIQRQAVENALGLAHYAVLKLSGGRFGAREVWFAHEQAMSLSKYRQYFSGTLRFNCPFNAIVFRSKDLAQAIPNQDRQVFDLAARYIDLQFPMMADDLVSTVRLLAARSLQTKRCSPEAIAAQVGLHPRSLQRQLRQAGVSFEALKDEARREAALHYLTRTDIALTRLAALLGYSETSVLTRSCKRWFGCTPNTLRLGGGS